MSGAVHRSRGVSGQRALTIEPSGSYSEPRNSPELAECTPKLQNRIADTPRAFDAQSPQSAHFRADTPLPHRFSPQAATLLPGRRGLADFQEAVYDLRSDTASRKHLLSPNADNSSLLPPNFSLLNTIKGGGSGRGSGPARRKTGRKPRFRPKSPSAPHLPPPKTSP
jgi:hypothetical protein